MNHGDLERRYELDRDIAYAGDDRVALRLKLDGSKNLALRTASSLSRLVR